MSIRAESRLPLRCHASLVSILDKFLSLFLIFMTVTLVNITGHGFGGFEAETSLHLWMSGVFLWLDSGYTFLAKQLQLILRYSHGWWYMISICPITGDIYLGYLMNLNLIFGFLKHTSLHF